MTLASSKVLKDWVLTMEGSGSTIYSFNSLAISSRFALSPFTALFISSGLDVAPENPESLLTFLSLGLTSSGSSLERRPKSF